MLTSGAVVAGYRIERVLGSGRMGTVYLARSPDLPRDDALKVLSVDLSHDPDFQVRFLREADVAAKLSHPNIVTVYRRGTTHDGLLWIAMQFVDGTDADTALRDGHMTASRAVHIVTEIAKALDYAHRRGVIHRDVKPANFLLSDDSDTEERVLLGDFGIADSMGQAEITMTGSVLATVAYAAPEVLYGKQVDGRADLYSLACSLFRLLTGRTPYPGDGDTATVIKGHLHEPPPRVTDFASHLPRAMNDVLIKALAKEPTERYQTGREFAAAAAEALNTPEPAPEPVVPSHRAPVITNPRQRKRRWLWSAAAVGTAAVVGVVALLLFNRSHDAEPTPAPTETTATATGGSPQTTAGAQSEGLGRYLLADERLGAILGTPMTTSATFTEPIDYAPTLVESDCGAAFGPIADPVYRGTGFTDLLSRTSSSTTLSPRQGGPSVQQSVVAFPSADAAKAAVKRQLEIWNHCSNGRLTRRIDPVDPTSIVGVSNVVDAGDGVSVLSLAVGPSTVCTRGLTNRGSTVVDAIVCQPDHAGRQLLDVVHGVTGQIG